MPAEDRDTGLYNALDNARLADIISVAAVGNYQAPPNPMPYYAYPAQWNDLTIAVGGIYESDSRYDGNYGCPTGCSESVPAFVDVVAPQNFLTITSLSDPIHLEGDWGYRSVSGTSVSTAAVAGLVALARSIKPKLPLITIKELLQTTAKLYDFEKNSPDSILRFGHGRVDACDFITEVARTSTSKLMNSYTDSIPYLIITNDSLAPFFQSLANKKTKQGTRTIIETVEFIDTATVYDGDDLQDKIRKCIDDYYNNYHLEYVILGGDETVVPFREVHNDIYGPGVDVISDYYYSCLDGTWDYDDDNIFGEVEDNVDLVPEIAVGRLPFTSAGEVSNYLTRLNDYETNVDADWREDAFFLGSKMFTYADGKKFSQDLQSYFPGEFSITGIYDDTGGTASKTNYFTNLNNGPNIVVQFALSQVNSNFFTHRWNYWDIINNNDIDTLLDSDHPSIIYSVTCQNHNIEGDCIAEHFMKNSNGGPVAYVGTAGFDYVFLSYEMTIEFFDQLFGNGPKEIGKLLNLGKSVIEEKSEREGSSRHVTFGYMLSGDPSMRIWTAQPEQLLISFPDPVMSGYHETMTVSVSSGGSPVENAVVCIQKVPSQIYEVGYTDAQGEITFTDLQTNPCSGEIIAAATKHNYFAAENSIEITPSEGGGCPMVFVYSDNKYKLENVILTGSEEPDRVSEKVVDYLPLEYMPDMDNGYIKIRISEIENEESHIYNTSLMAYDISDLKEGERLAISSDGRLVAMSNPTKPVSVFENGSLDVTSSLLNKDNNWFQSNAPGSLVVNFDIQDIIGGAGKVMAGGDGIPIDPPPKGGNKLTVSSNSEYLQNNYLVVNYIDNEGIGSRAGAVYPRIRGSLPQMVPISGNANSNGMLSYSFTWTRDYKADEIASYNFHELSIIDERAISIATDNQSGDVTGLFSDAKSYYKLTPNNYVDIEFSAKGFTDNKNIRFVLRTEGYYFRQSSKTAYGENGVLPNFVFEQNHPNPFNPSTTFSFNLPNASQVNLTVYNTLGQKVVEVVDEFFTAGRHQVFWNGNDSNGKSTASGIYFAKFKAGDFTDSKKMVIVK